MNMWIRDKDLRISINNELQCGVWTDNSMMGASFCKHRGFLAMCVIACRADGDRCTTGSRSCDMEWPNGRPIKIRYWSTFTTNYGEQYGGPCWANQISPIKCYLLNDVHWKQHQQRHLWHYVLRSQFAASSGADRIKRRVPGPFVTPCPTLAGCWGTQITDLLNPISTRFPDVTATVEWPPCTASMISPSRRLKNHQCDYYWHLPRPLLT
jgi:hypothetical protein